MKVQVLFNLKCIKSFCSETVPRDFIHRRLTFSNSLIFNRAILLFQKGVKIRKLSELIIYVVNIELHLIFLLSGIKPSATTMCL